MKAWTGLVDICNTILVRSYVSQPCETLVTTNGQRLAARHQTAREDLILTAHNDQEPGFLRITIDNKKKTVTSNYFLVPFDGTPLINRRLTQPRET